MTWEDMVRGGNTTLERYGRKHYSRISKGKNRRGRYSERKASRLSSRGGGTDGRGGRTSLTDPN